MRGLWIPKGLVAPIFTAFLLVASAFSQTGAGDQMVNSLRENVVKIQTELPTHTENGFGFIVGERSGRLYVVTAYHVVADRDVVGPEAVGKVKVEFFERRGKMYDAEVLGTQDLRHDLAVLTVPAPQGVAWKKQCLAGPEKQRHGVPVWFVGINQEWKPPVAPGHVLTETSVDWLMELEGLNIREGSSGGPVISDSGIIGMIKQDSNAGSYALSIDFIKKLFAEWHHPWELRAAPADVPPPVSSEVEAVLKVVDLYVASYNHRDASALWVIWPGPPQHVKQTIEESFRDARSIAMDVQPGDPEIIGGSTAAVRGQYTQEYVGRNGSHQKSKGEITLHLVKKNGTWFVTSVY